MAENQSTNPKIYSPEEIEALRAQLRRGAEVARQECQKSGVTVAPRIAAAKEAARAR